VGETVKICEIRRLSVSYVLRNEIRLRAVEDLSLTVNAGEVVGILGESGCGKSTLAGAMVRLLPAYAECGQGEILLNGRDLLKLDESKLRAIRGREIALVSQDPALSLNPVMKVGTQINEVMRAHLTLGAEERRMRVVELLGEMGFDRPEEIYGAYPHQLSGGERQRIAIAQAISCRPSLVIADEPTSKLDASLQAEVIGLFAKIRREYGIAIVLISHDPGVLAGLADRIAVMYAGKIVELGSAAQIFRQPLHPYTQAFVRIAMNTFAGSQQAQTRFAAIEGEPPDPTNFPAGCRFHPRCADRMDVCGERYPADFLPEPARPVSCFKYGN
jgi:peptide/nickel transport system ATP-binding protein